jgi:protocatechuate 3,4-dioxygenase beta subunit
VVSRAIVLLLCLVLSAEAQTPSKSSADPVNTISISGTVVKADTGEPLKKVSVALWSNERQTSYEAFTDAEGRFKLKNVQPGRYRLWASHEGYVSAAYQEKTSRRRAPTLVLTGGQELRDVVFRLQRAPVITGRVVDEDGEPIQGANVTVSAYRPQGGRRRFMGPSVQTNDLGEYRIFHLDPGRYLLSVTPEGRYEDAWAVMRAPDAAQRQESDQKVAPPVYPITFYPGTTDATQATPLQLKAGDELRFDFTLTPVHPFKIRGHVLGLRPKSNEAVAVVLSPRNGRGDNQQAGRVRSDGSYEITGVLPGSYRLSVSTEGDLYNPEMQRSAMRSIEVTNGDLENIDVMLRPAGKMELMGQLAVEAETQPRLDRFVVRLISGEGDDEFFGGNAVGVKPDGTFSFQQVLPGTYSVEVNSMSGGGRDYYVKSGRYGSRELVQASFTVTEASSPRLELVLSSETARVEGVVVDDKDVPVPGATVVAVPASKFSNLEYWYPDGVTDQNGKFVLPRLRPGDYRLVAFEDADYRDSVDPTALEKSESAGVRAQVQAGATANLKVRVIPAPADTQQ